MTDHHARPFADFLREHTMGATHDELTAKLAQLVTQVQATGKKGTLTLKLTISPFDKGDNAPVEITDVISMTTPQLPRPKTLFYSKQGFLSRENPNQPTFEGLRALDTPAAPINPFTKEA